MKTGCVAFFFACCCVGAVQAGALALTSVKPYDFNSIVVKGTGVGDATMTVNGAPATTTKVSADELVATGLLAGNVYKYVVTLGADSASGEVVMGSGTGKLFGADATSGSEVLTSGSWNTTAPNAAPQVADSKFTLPVGSACTFDVQNGLMSNRKIVYIDSSLTFSDAVDELDDTIEALGAFTLAMTNLTGEAYFWAGLMRDGDTVKWVKLTGSVSPATGTYVSRMQFDFNQSPAKVRYLLGEDAANLTALHDDGGQEWFTVALEADKVSSVSYEGNGAVAKLEGHSIDTAVATVGSTDYPTIAAALAADKNNPTVTLHTNTRPAANAALVGGNWTISSGDFAFEPYETLGYTFTYAGSAFAVSAFQTSVDISTSHAIGFDFTNGVFNVALANANIQEGTSLSLKVTVKDASGTTVAEQNYAGITGNTAKVIPNFITTPKGEYFYEVVVKMDDAEVARETGSFFAGNQANWFSADSSNWAYNGAWSKDGEPVTVTGAKLALGGNQYDFTPEAPSVSNALVRVDTVVEITGPFDNDDLPELTDVQGVIALVETSADVATPVWKAYNGTAWIPLTGGETDPGTYKVRAEFNYSGSTKAVRYSVALGDGELVVLKNGAEEWIANPKQNATTLNSASAYGVGNLVSVKGDNIDSFVASANGMSYETLAAALAAGMDVKLLWDCTWTPTVAGRWNLDVNGKTLTINPNGNWYGNLTDNVLQAVKKVPGAFIMLY